MKWIVTLLVVGLSAVVFSGCDVPGSNSTHTENHVQFDDGNITIIETDGSGNVIDSESGTSRTEN